MNPADIQLYFVDDDPRAGKLFRRFCQQHGMAVDVFTDPVEALEAAKKSLPSLFVTDLKMPGMTGIELLEAIRTLDKDVPVIITTGYSTVENAVEALRLGATDFIRKPYDMEELLHQIEQTLEHRALKTENQELRRELARTQGEREIIGKSTAVENLRKLISKVASYRCNIIIEGESGTGKELVARDLHALGNHADSPFVVIDCGALTDTLLETELFGHERGAFTGAEKQRKGRLEQASGGTLFLDEIGNISDAMQTKLLRVIQEQQVTRVGGSETLPIDVQFIAASNRNLPQMIEDGEFRHDLYHRLNVVEIRVPALRDRKEDIPLLTEHFVKEFEQQHGITLKLFDAEDMESLMNYHWPGNIRELRNLVERHVILADEGQLKLTRKLDSISQQNCSDSLTTDQPDLKTLEERYIHKVLKEVGDNREQAAKILGINKSTLWRKLQQYD